VPAVLQLAEHVLRGLDVGRVPLSQPPVRATWLAPVGRRFIGAGLDDLLVVSRSGWLTRRTHAAPHGRVQSLRLHQGPLLRRLRLATVYVDSPPGPVAVRLLYRDAAEARALLNREAVLARRARTAQDLAANGEPTPTAETTQ
jgi:putative membrane protein